MIISVLGAGNMGTAIAKVLADNSHEVKLWSIEDDVVCDISNNHLNTKYLPNVKLGKNISVSSSISDSLKDASIVVFAVPSHFVRVVCEKAKGLISDDCVIVNLGKGLEDAGKRLSEVFSEFFNNPLVVVGGPCIAAELARNAPSFVVFASSDEKAINVTKRVFENDYYHISVSGDVVGVELCGFLKNVIAILAGVSDGLGYGANAKAGFITNGLKELSLIASSLGADSNTVFGLAGLGDLVVTCVSPSSRNRSFGEFLGKGLSKKEAFDRVSQVVEGVNAVEIAINIINEKGLYCPLIRRVHSILNGGL